MTLAYSFFRTNYQVKGRTDNFSARTLNREDTSMLTDPKKVKKLTKFFGEDPPLLRLFLRKLGYEVQLTFFLIFKLLLLNNFFTEICSIIWKRKGWNGGATIFYWRKIAKIRSSPRTKAKNSPRSPVIGVQRDNFMYYLKALNLKIK